MNAFRYLNTYGFSTHANTQGKTAVVWNAFHDDATSTNLFSPGVESSAASGGPSSGTESKRGWGVTNARKMMYDGIRRLQIWRTLFGRNTHTSTLPVLLALFFLSLSPVPYHVVVWRFYVLNLSLILHLYSHKLDHTKALQCSQNSIYLFTHLHMYWCSCLRTLLENFEKKIHHSNQKHVTLHAVSF